jgi:hypothetical protein
LVLFTGLSGMLSEVQRSNTLYTCVIKGDKHYATFSFSVNAKV